MMKKKLLLLLTSAIIIVLIPGAHAQYLFPPGSFHSPMDIPLVVSGTYGDMRAAHMHAGVDYRTQGVENKSIFSIDEGYVSRIKISAFGYGKAIYITHPNGYLSVYAHLNRFSDKIEEFVRREHYARRSFEIDVYFPANLIPIAGGEFIGYSGNTGSSGGPHLHFEIRNAATQHTYNPFMFGFDAKDTRPPVMNSLKIYPYGTDSRVNGGCDAITNRLVRRGNTYVRQGQDTIRVSGSFYVGMLAHDLLDGGPNRCGVYSMTVSVDEKIIHHHVLETMSFDKGRHYISFIDFAESRRSRNRYMTTYKAPNNHHPVYRISENSGIYTFGDEDMVVVKIVLADFAKNESVLVFPVKNDRKSYPPCAPECSPEMLILYDRPFSFKAEGFNIHIPPHALFDSSCFRWSASQGQRVHHSSVISVGNPDVPVLNAFELRIKPYDYFPINLYDKLLIAEVSGNRPTARGGRPDASYIVADLRAFGDYALMIDTIPPRLSTSGWSSGAVTARNRRELRFTVTDDLSGVATYNAYLNGEWVLLEYDAKTNTLFFRPTKNFEQGTHSLRVVAGDERGNITTLNTSFTVN